MANEEAPESDNSQDTSDRKSGVYLRRARRKARKLGLHANNDEHAAELLEERGIDVLKDDVSLIDVGNEDVLVSTGDATTPPSMTLNDAERLAEVHTIQRQLVRRRRFRLFLLMLRMMFFVGLPTFMVGNYYYNIATPMYETKAEFVIQKSESAGGGGLAGLFAGTGFANSADSIVVQGYLTSREAMMRLDAELGYRAHFQQSNIDDLQRLPENASLEEAFKLYKKYTTVGYDPTEGVIRMEVVATSPEVSEAFTRALIRYAEERVDELSERVRRDQMAGTIEVYSDAELAMRTAQEKVLALQQLRGVLSAEAEAASQMGIINSLELLIEEKRLDLGVILDNPSPNPIRVDILRREIERLTIRIAELRSHLTETTDGNVSIATISGELQIAETDMLTRQAMLQQALQQVETARIEANRQVRYLSMGVSPIAPDVPSYPRKIESTSLAFVIFFGIYIMLSLTISILREQVSV